MHKKKHVYIYMVYDSLPKPLPLIHITEPTRQAEISYAAFCLKKKNKKTHNKRSMPDHGVHFTVSPTNRPLRHTSNCITFDA